MEQREINDILVSWITISFAFANISSLIFNQGGLDNIIVNFIIMLVAVGAGFILHELAHKYAAIHYGAHAEYRAWKVGLIIAVVLALIGSPLIFAAPGAVYIFENRKRLTLKQNGIISLAGPLTNIIIAAVLFLLFIAINPTGMLGGILAATVRVNFFLATFNLLPIPPLDGSKVFMWSKATWLIAIIGAGFGTFFL